MNNRNQEVMTRRIVLVSCASRKIAQRATARDLYDSPLFKLSMRYAEKLKPDEIFILSAKHGLLSLDKEIEPYEKTLNNMSTNEVMQWASRVLQQINQVCFIDETEFTFLAGNTYRRYLVPHLKHTQIPLEGLPIGKQLQKLKGLLS